MCDMEKQKILSIRSTSKNDLNYKHLYRFQGICMMELVGGKQRVKLVKSTIKVDVGHYCED